ncbi:hypothetical protein D9M71_492500 [compost metagenome]
MANWNNCRVGHRSGGSTRKSGEAGDRDGSQAWWRQCRWHSASSCCPKGGMRPAHCANCLPKSWSCGVRQRRGCSACSRCNRACVHCSAYPVGGWATHWAARSVGCCPIPTDACRPCFLASMPSNCVSSKQRSACCVRLWQSRSIVWKGNCKHSRTTWQPGQAKRVPIPSRAVPWPISSWIAGNAIQGLEPGPTLMKVIV